MKKSKRKAPGSVAHPETTPSAIGKQVYITATQSMSGYYRAGRIL